MTHVNNGFTTRKICECCGKLTRISYTGKVCKDCRFKHGTIWTFDMSLPMDEWKWERLKNE